MKTLIKNGTIVTSELEYNADVFIEDEKIAAIATKIDIHADKVIDAKGKYVFPGGIDQHTHFDALCNVGDKNTGGYEGTVATLVGGTTTIVDYAPQDPGKGLLDSISYRINTRTKGLIATDFALHALVTEAGDKILDEIPHLAENGISSIKLFMAYKGSPLYVDDGMLFRVFEKAAKYGITVFVHTENADLISMLQKRYVSEGKIEPKYHALSRPPYVEAEAAQRAITIATAAGAPVLLVHISCKEAVDAIRNARSQNLPVFGESVTHHLVFTAKELERDNFEGAKFVCSPPLRDESHIEALWDALKKGWLQVVASDHCGIDFKVMKQFGKDNFVAIPNGSPGAGDRVHMIWTNGVAKGKISRQKFVEITSTAAAKINGIYPQKGTISVGSDADIVIFDPEYRSVVKYKDNPNEVDYNVYEGLEQCGRSETVLLRGKVSVENGKFIGSMGQGKFIKSKAYAACYE